MELKEILKIVRKEKFSNPQLSVKLFACLLDPITPGHFFDTFWEKQVLHVTRASFPAYFRSVMSSSKMDRIFRENLLHFNSDVDIIKCENGEMVSQVLYGKARPPLIWYAYDHQTTIHLRNPHIYKNNVRGLLVLLQDYFQSAINADIYLSPPGIQELAPYDCNYETFVMQLEGTSHWKLYKNHSKNPSDCFKQELGSLLFEFDLNAGDLLYLPRGLVQGIYSTSQKHSLLITLATYQHTSYMDMMEAVMTRALKEATEHDNEFTRRLPLHYLKNVGVAEFTDVQDNIMALFRKLSKYVDFDHVADQFGIGFIGGSVQPVCTQAIWKPSFTPGGKLKDKFKISVTTMVRLNRCDAMRLTREESGLVLYFSADNERMGDGVGVQFIKIDKAIARIYELLHVHFPSFVSLVSLEVKDSDSALEFLQQLWMYDLLITKRAY